MHLFPILLASVFSFFGGSVSAPNALPEPKPAVVQPTEEPVKWMTIQEAETACKAKPKKILIDVYTDWCGWCKRMDANTFSNPTVAAYLNEKYYCVKLNAEQKEDITFLGQTFKFVASGRGGYNQLAFELLQGRLSYPTIAFMDENFYFIQPIPGYQTPEQMYPILRYFGTDAFRTQGWEDFQKSYVSPFTAPAPQQPSPGAPAPGSH
jgi:thioredoxin-related protein